MSRLRFDLVPDTFEKARRTLDESFRTLRTVLDRGFRWREQVSCVLDTVVDVAALPSTYDTPGVRGTPTSVHLLRAIEQRSGSGRYVSGGAVTWEWRGGRLLIVDVDALSSGRWDVTLAVME